MADYSAVPTPEYRETQVVEEYGRDVRQFRTVTKRVETNESSGKRRMAVLAAMDANGSHIVLDHEHEPVSTDLDTLQKSAKAIGDGRFLYFRKGGIIYRVRPGEKADLRVDQSEVVKVMKQLESQS